MRRKRPPSLLPRCAGHPSALEVSGGRAEKALSGALAPVKRPPSLLFFVTRATAALPSRY